MANVIEVLKEADWVEEEVLLTELVGGYESDDKEYFCSLPEAESFTNSGFIESHVSLEFNESAESKEEVLICYASAVKLQPTWQLTLMEHVGPLKGLTDGLFPLADVFEMPKSKFLEDALTTTFSLVEKELANRK